ncbi:MAG: hypothetical protein ABSF43_01185 [Rectinemataceae bacterium]|jgi:type I restriction enzyme R subunit
MKNYTETAFETAIEFHLVEKDRYRRREHGRFDRALCLDTEVFVEFVKATQPKEWAYLTNIHKSEAAKVLIDDLARALGSEHEGTL